MGTDVVKADLAMFRSKLSEIRGDLEEMRIVQGDEWRDTAQGIAVGYAIERIDAAISVLWTV